MVNKFLLLVLFTISYCFNINSQIRFEKGYILDNENSKIECYIKNTDSNYTPSKFTYKLTKESDELTGTLEKIKGYGIGAEVKYIRAAVLIDYSKDNLSALNYKMNPEYISDTLFLKVLVEGEASLYQYEKNSLNRFFYKKKESDQIEPLDYKKYKTKEDKIKENNRYKQQLQLYLQCGTEQLIEKISYSEKKLIHYFEAYNLCKNTTYVKYDQKKKRKTFNIEVKYEALWSDTKLYLRDVLWLDFGNHLISQYGLSFEYILPFNKNKWTIFADPSYQTFTKKVQREHSAIPNSKEDVVIKHSALEIPIGIRYYAFLSKRSKLFLNTAYVTDFYAKTKVKHINDEFLNTKETSGNFIFGFGYSYSRFSIELRKKTNKDISIKSPIWRTDHKGVSLLFRATIF